MTDQRNGPAHIQFGEPMSFLRLSKRSVQGSKVSASPQGCRSRKAASLELPTQRTDSNDTRDSFIKVGKKTPKAGKV